MRIAVFGLGYVGTVSAACLASRGHAVVGVDVSEAKVATISEGRSPVLERGLPELIAESVADGRLRATTSVEEAVEATDLAFICVGTPSAPTGALSTSYLERVASDLGRHLPHDRRYVVVVRSTVLPGTVDTVVVPLLESSSGLRAPDGFGVCVHPEFLREGSAVRDFLEPPKTVVGASRRADGTLVASLYEGLPGPVFVEPPGVAEMVKYVDNAFHATKVAFANEVGAICKSRGIDSHAVMDIFKSDVKLNISTAYLTPGGPFGGSCLPKDLRALTYHARHADVAAPLLSSVITANEAHLDRAYALITASGRRRVGIFGLAFKSGTDDLRESPLVTIAERLIGRGYDVLIHDANVLSSRLTGSNRDYVDSHLPHLSRLLRPEPEDVLAHAEVCVVGTADAEVLEVVKRAEDRLVVDLVRVPEVTTPGNYDGICW